MQNEKQYWSEAEIKTVESSRNDIMYSKVSSQLTLFEVK